MATQPRVFRNPEAFTTTNRPAEVSRHAPARVERDPYLLRELPLQDVIFYSKKIDNSRLVRQADPRGGAENWTAIVAVCALMIVLITSLAPGVAGIISGYQIQALKQEQQRLLNERSLLEVEEARLTSPERLDHLAKERHMAIPTRAQLVRLPSTTKDAGALNARRARR